MLTHPDLCRHMASLGRNEFRQYHNVREATGSQQTYHDEPEPEQNRAYTQSIGSIRLITSAS